MLPDFPEFKRNFRLALDYTVSSGAKSGALLNSVRSSRHFEGSKHMIAGDSPERPYQQAEGLLKIHHQEIADGGPELVLERGAQAGAEMRVQAENHLMGVLQDAARRGAAGMSMGSGSITPQSLLDAFEAADVSFDGAGRHNLRIIAGPQAGLAIEKCHREIAENPKYEQRARNILERKRRDWLSRKSSRGLAD